MGYSHALYIRREVESEIKEAEMYSIVLAGTPEQVIFLVWFLHYTTLKERFVEVCNVDTTGKDLEIVLSLLQKNDLKNM